MFLNDGVNPLDTILRDIEEVTTCPSPFYDWLLLM